MTITTGMSGLSIGPDSPCHDPGHPWWLPDWLHDAYECNCLLTQGLPPDDLCVFALPGGTPATYTRPDNVKSVSEIVVETPGWLIGNAATIAAEGTARGLGSGLGAAGSAIAIAAVAAVGVIGFMVFVKR